ncbi:TetR/AcrR family transcriptional regulator [Endozoicomonas numazuensis]|uniref:TetR family transcriptional regulator n=1 Tax=Endozoicomonas numazuensis TaxID=1137799 RepID=A0A081NIZ4_9GAMM|nr:TetR/AcrR family transcriptional regulator [Endozoicomonas numazuensis]KEQ18417.1 TetR family transcriptional regulator [Endozoicomonas numazuensis]
MSEIPSVLQTLLDQKIINAPDSAKGRLLRTAAHLFVERGYERTTVRELAKALGIQSGSLFYHYPNKAAILKAVLVETIHINTARMQEALSRTTNPKQQVLALIRCEIESIIGDTGEAMSLLLSEWRSLTEESQADILELRDQYESLWLNSLKACEKDGLLVIDPHILRHFLRGAISWVKVWYDPDGRLDLEQLCEMTLTMAVKQG